MKNNTLAKAITITALVLSVFLVCGCVGLFWPDPHIVMKSIYKETDGENFTIYVDVVVENQGKSGNIRIGAELSYREMTMEIIYKKEEFETVYFDEGETKTVTFAFPDAPSDNPDDYGIIVSASVKG